MKNLFTNELKKDLSRLYNTLLHRIENLETEKTKYQQFYNNKIEFLTNGNFNKTTVTHLINISDEPIQIEKINQKIQNANEVIKAIETIVKMYKQNIEYIGFNEYLDNILYGDDEDEE